MRQESPAANGPDELTDQQMTQIEIDMRRMADSGYSIDDLNIPMTPELQRLVNEIKLSSRAKEIDEENFSRQMQLADQKNAQKENGDDYAEAMQKAAMQEWLGADHEFAGMSHTGREWQQIADYAKRNREQIEKDWSDRLDAQELNKGFRLLDILGRGPRNEEERRLVEESKRNPDMQDFVQDVEKKSGVQHGRNVTSRTSVEHDEKAYETSKTNQSSINDTIAHQPESMISANYNVLAKGEVLPMADVGKSVTLINKAPAVEANI